MTARKGLKSIALSAVLLGSLVPLAPAGASDHQPPRARLVTGDHVQARRPYTTCWSSDRTAFCADGFPKYRRAIPAQAGERVKIRIGHPAEIERADLDGYRRVRDTDYGQQAYGRHRDFNIRVRANRSNGEIQGWRIGFRLPERQGDLYLDFDLDWETHGDAFYALHVRIR